ncbi:MAG: AAA family ATPase [bacterium]
MYLKYWALKRPPFQNLPDTEYFMETPKHREALVRLLYAVKGGKGSAMLTGEVGCGKTMLCFKLLEELKKDKYDSVVITNPTLPALDFLKQIYEGIGGHPVPRTKREIILAMTRHSESKHREGREIVIVVDEAHLIIKRRGLYEEIRMLLNYQRHDRFLFTVLLVGQPELLSGITNIPQLRQRIAIKFHLEPLSQLETQNYILHRLKVSGAEREVFTPAAIEEIYNQSNGIPRVINTVCDLSLLIAYGGQRERVDRPDVNNIRELLV